MSSTNKTTHYELPQFVENDIFNPLVDDNDAYDKIDTALYNIASSEADDAAEIIDIKSRLDAAEGKVTALETQNGTNVLTTVAQTLSGAVNELKSGEDSLDGRLDVVEDDINNASTGLKVKVDSLETTTEQLSENVSGISLEVVKHTKQLLGMPRKMHGNMLIDIARAATDGTLNGSAYIGENKAVLYFAKSASNTGVLMCINIATYEVIWQYNLELYHGNSITYVEDENSIYVAGCLDVENSGYTNKIFVVNLDAPNTIARTIEAPSELVYSLCYDESKEVFYGITALGTTEGVSNVMTVYNKALTAVLRTVILKEYAGTKYQHSCQGVQYAKNGIVYWLGYDEEMNVVGANDVTTGDIVEKAMLPKVINNIRLTGEPESIFYDFDNDRWIVGAALYYTGVDGYYANFLYEIDLYKGIDEYRVTPQTSDFGVITNLDNFYYIIMGAAGLKPPFKMANNIGKYPIDGITLSKSSKCFIDIALQHTYGNYTEQNYVIGYLDVSGANVRIRGVSSADKVPVKHVKSSGNAKVEFLWCEFTDAHEHINGIVCQIMGYHYDNYFFQECIFDDFEDRAGKVNINMWMIHNAIANIAVTTTEQFNSMFLKTGRKIGCSFFGRINCQGDTYLNTINKNDISYTADTYVYTGIEFDIAKFMVADVWFQKSTGGLKGVILSTSNIALADNNKVFISENETTAMQTSIMKVTGGQHYYVWVKANSTETAQGSLRYTDVHSANEY